jgi:hypothetical protein
MTTIREAAVARARYAGFAEAGELLRKLADAGLSTAMIAAAMDAQKHELLDAAEAMEAEAEETTEYRAQRRAARAEA